MKTVNFSGKFFRLSVGIFKNFWDCFQKGWDKFQDCFQIVRVKISGLFSNSLDEIFITVSGSPGLGSGLVLIPGLMSSGFVVCFGIPIIR